MARHGRDREDRGLSLPSGVRTVRGGITRVVTPAQGRGEDRQAARTTFFKKSGRGFTQVSLQTGRGEDKQGGGLSKAQFAAFSPAVKTTPKPAAPVPAPTPVTATATPLPPRGPVSTGGASLNQPGLFFAPGLGSAQISQIESTVGSRRRASVFQGRTRGRRSPFLVPSISSGAKLGDRSVL